MDYEALLRKYIAHVNYWEGSYFISDSFRDDFCSDEEWKTLQRLRDEAIPDLPPCTPST